MSKTISDKLLKEISTYRKNKYEYFFVITIIWASGKTSVLSYYSISSLFKALYYYLSYYYKSAGIKRIDVYDYNTYKETSYYPRIKTIEFMKQNIQKFQGL